MRFYLRSIGLWCVVENDIEPTPLTTNPSLARIRAHEDEKLKKDRAITCLHVGFTDSIFTKIMNMQTPKQVRDKLQSEYEGSNRFIAFRLLTLKREFELMKMKDSETVKEYLGRLTDCANQIRLLGEFISDQKVVENIMVLVPQRFEAKLLAIEKTYDFESLTITKLTSK